MPDSMTESSAPTLDRLPHDAKVLIASFLSGHQIKRLVLVNRAWRAAGEVHLRSRLIVPPLHDLHSPEEAESWTRLRQLLESQPDSITPIKHMRVVANKRGMEHRNAVIKMVSPYLVSLTELHSCADHSVNADCRWALLSQYSLAMQPLPALEHLVIHVDGAWSLSLPGLLRLTPNLITLGLNGEIDDLVLPLGIEMWPKLVRLTTLSLDTLSESLDTELFYTLVPLCGNLQTVNLKLDSLTWEDEERIMSCLYPVRYAPNVEHMHLDLPWQAEEGIQGWYERLYSERSMKTPPTTTIPIGRHSRHLVSNGT